MGHILRQRVGVDGGHRIACIIVHKKGRTLVSRRAAATAAAAVAVEGQAGQSLGAAGGLPRPCRRSCAVPLTLRCRGLRVIGLLVATVVIAAVHLICRAGDITG